MIISGLFCNISLVSKMTSCAESVLSYPWSSTFWSLGIEANNLRHGSLWPLKLKDLRETILFIPSKEDIRDLEFTMISKYSTLFQSKDRFPFGWFNVNLFRFGKSDKKFQFVLPVGGHLMTNSSNEGRAGKPLTLWNPTITKEVRVVNFCKHWRSIALAASRNTNFFKFLNICSPSSVQKPGK